MNPLEPEESGAGYSVIVIDDEEEALNSYVRLLGLKSEFFCAQAFRDGQSALRWMDQSERRPDVVLTDIMMPGMSGIECARAIKTRFATTKIVMMTGFSQNRLLKEALAIGVDGYLSKPFGKKQLVATLHAVMASQTVVYAKFCEEINAFTPSELVHHTDLNDLSTRQKHVMACLAVGKTNREIAQKLDVSLALAKKLVHEIFAELGAKNRTDAVRLWSAMPEQTDMEN